MEMFIFANGAVVRSEERLVRASDIGFSYLFQAVLGLPNPELSNLLPNGAVCLAARAAGYSDSSVSVAESPEHFVLFYGDAGEFDLPQIARRFDDAPAEDVIAEIAGGDGCFGCLVYAKRTGIVRLFGDMAGQRTLRWTRLADGSVLVSSHDVGLIATGAFQPLLDRTSMDSAATVGWSLGDASYFTGISVCRAGNLVTLHPAGSVPAGQDRDVVTCLRATERCTAPIADLAVASLERSLGGRRQITAELSAGFDSRASLAALLALRQPHEITAFCEGPETSDDVITARRICERTGIRLEHWTTPALSEVEEDAFVRAWSRAAVECNGNFNTSVLASRIAADDAVLGGMSVCGDGGEIYRGVYEPYRPYGSLIGTPERPAEEVLARKFLSEGRNYAVLRRLTDVMARLRRGARSEAHVLQRFYVTERFGVWNQKLARAGGGRRRIGPFYGRHAMRAVDESAETAAMGRRLHHTLVARYLPAALDLPLNGEASMQRYSGRRFDNFVLETRVLTGKVGRRLGRAWGARNNDLEGARSETMTRMSACVIAASEARLLIEGTRFRGGVEEIEREIAQGGDESWTELAAERFARICGDLYQAVTEAPEWRLLT